MGEALGAAVVGIVSAVLASRGIGPRAQGVAAINERLKLLRKLPPSSARDALKKEVERDVVEDIARRMPAASFAARWGSIFNVTAIVSVVVLVALSLIGDAPGWVDSGMWGDLQWIVIAVYVVVFVLTAVAQVMHRRSPISQALRNELRRLDNEVVDATRGTAAEGRPEAGA